MSHNYHYKLERIEDTTNHSIKAIAYEVKDLDSNEYFNYIERKSVPGEVIDVVVDDLRVNPDFSPIEYAFQHNHETFCYINTKNEPIIAEANLVSNLDIIDMEYFFRKFATVQKCNEMVDEIYSTMEFDVLIGDADFNLFA